MASGDHCRTHASEDAWSWLGAAVVRKETLPVGACDARGSAGCGSLEEAAVLLVQTFDHLARTVLLVE